MAAHRQGDAAPDHELNQRDVRQQFLLGHLLRLPLIDPCNLRRPEQRGDGQQYRHHPLPDAQRRPGLAAPQMPQPTAAMAASNIKRKLTAAAPGTAGIMNPPF
ncbi:hypothetical protein [Comamonas thiooxydans]|uniref:hypothetical protein n=1 Tax=Comamonas thiooxydans TaxID=363952 RepID=UPI00103F38D8|nr:hypothetical protein [Comamonas thiooxydans]